MQMHARMHAAMPARPGSRAVAKRGRGEKVPSSGGQAYRAYIIWRQRATLSLSLLFAIELLAWRGGFDLAELRHGQLLAELGPEKKPVDVPTI